MVHQFDVFRLPSGVRVVNIQSNLLSHLRTRVVMVLEPFGTGHEDLGRLTPTFTIDGEKYLACAQTMATLTLSELGEPETSLAGQHDEIVRALDMLISGI